MAPKSKTVNPQSVLLRQLRASAYATLGTQHTGPFVESLGALLLAQQPVEALHYDEQEIAWCEATWKSLKKVLDNILLAAAPASAMTGPLLANPAGDGLVAGLGFRVGIRGVEGGRSPPRGGVGGVGGGRAAPPSIITMSMISLSSLLN